MDGILEFSLFIAFVLLIMMLIVLVVRDVIRRLKKSEDKNFRRENVDTLTWPSRSVLILAGFIAFCTYFIPTYSSQVAFHPEVKLFFSYMSFLGGLISLSVCSWWYYVSKKKSRREKLSRGIGYILFAVGSMTSFPGVIGAEMVFLKTSYMQFEWLLFLYLLSLVLSATLVAGAYYLVFRTKQL